VGEVVDAVGQFLVVGEDEAAFTGGEQLWSWVDE